MAGRIRSIKPELLEDAKAAKLTDSAWRLFVSGLLLADDFGVLRAEPGQLIGAVFWSASDHGRDVKIGKLIEELVVSKLWITYSVDDQAYAFYTGWHKHQKVDRPNETRRLPTPDMASAKDRGNPAKDRGAHATDHDHDHDHDHIPPEKLSTDPDVPTGEDLQRALREAYKFYPLKIEKKEGLRKATTLIKTLADLRAFEAACVRMGDAWKGQDLQFCKGFSVFVNTESWRPNADELLPFPRKPERAAPTGSSRELDYNR